MRTLRKIAGVLVALALLPSMAMAQAPTGDGGATASPSGWIFNFAPYGWVPTVHADLSYNLPPALGGRLPTDVSTGPGDYLSKLHFATMFAADARYDRFSALTDFMYFDGGSGSTNIRSLDFFGRPSMPISRSLETSTSSNMQGAIWTLAGGYTLLRGDWGNFDVLAGFRFFNMKASTDFDLALTVVGPRGNGATFGGTGNISGATSIWNGIAGVRGRIRLPVEGLFIPYYFDIGGGGSKLTWQIASGVGYQTGWAGVSLMYRYMSFEQDGSSLVRHLGMGGPMIMGNFTF